MKKHHPRSSSELPNETIVDAEYVEQLMVQGSIQLTDEQLKQVAQGGEIWLPTSIFEALEKPKRTKPDWITVIDAVHFLSPYVGGDTPAKSIIAERLRDGAVRATALWIAEEPDVGALPDRRPKQAYWKSPVNNGKGVTMPVGSFWTYSDDWDRDLKRWNWRDGLVVAVRGQGQTATRMVVKGLRVDRADVQQIVTVKQGLHLGGESKTSELGPSKTKSNSGRKRSESWNDWVAEVVIFAAAEGLDLNESAERFISRVEELLQARNVPYPESHTVERAVSAIRNRWREAKANREIE